MKCMFALIFVVLLTACALAGEESRDQDVEDLKEEISQLRQRIEEQQELHGDRIEKLERRLEELRLELEADKAGEKASKVEEELAQLRREAEELAGGREEPTGPRGEFRSRGLGLQALNPEISVTGDLLYQYNTGSDSLPRSDFIFRTLGIHIESYLDPYSRFKAAVPVDENGAKLGEAYLTRYGVLPGCNLTFGKFRQQFGVVNRWHKHALDYVDFPLPLRQIFGNGGLNQAGVALVWSGALGQAAQEGEVQVTDGDNDRVFGQNGKNQPSILVHYKVNRELSPSTYMEVGATGMAGWNDTWPLAGGMVEESTEDTWLYGVDLGFLWEPTDRMRYRNVESRTEVYCLHKGIRAPDGSGGDTIAPWGAYTSLMTRLTRDIELGARFDYYEPDVKDYAALPGLSLAPLAVTKSGACQTLSAVYLTWLQSPFVKFRIEYDYLDGKGIGEKLHRVYLQCVFAAGPHKHERY